MTNPARAVDNGDTRATPASRAVDGSGYSRPDPPTSPNVLRTPRAGTLSFHCQPVPKHQAFHRDFNRLTPDTLRAINDLVVQAAVDLGLEDGSKLRVDTTVVETDIH